jgi:hypothetical protein
MLLIFLFLLLLLVPLGLFAASPSSPQSPRSPTAAASSPSPSSPSPATGSSPSPAAAQGEEGAEHDWFLEMGFNPELAIVQALLEDATHLPGPLVYFFQFKLKLNFKNFFCNKFRIKNS